MNNIYVETIPETCEECEFCEHFGKDAHGKGKHEVACYFNGFLTNALLGDTINAKHCSHLKPLTDRLAEERKKVCDKIRHNAISHNNLEVDMYYISPEQLDQIERNIDG